MQNQMYFGKVHQESLRRVLEFYYDDEEKHFMESDSSDVYSHIFQEISWLLNELDKHDRNVQIIEEHKHGC
tara:strand:- start:159 stop:371 length:213 start_codon:yes stop_codon:yes gene_type:complete